MTHEQLQQVLVQVFDKTTTDTILSYTGNTPPTLGEVIAFYNTTHDEPLEGWRIDKLIMYRDKVLHP